MLGWERQNKRHYHQTVEEMDHYTSVSDCPCTQPRGVSSYKALCRNQEDISIENLGALIDSVRNRMETLVDYTINEMKTLDKHFAIVM
jgi:hypothetical protein